MSLWWIIRELLNCVPFPLNCEMWSCRSVFFVISLWNISVFSSLFVTFPAAWCQHLLMDSFLSLKHEERINCWDPNLLIRFSTASFAIVWTNEKERLERHRTPWRTNNELYREHVLNARTRSDLLVRNAFLLCVQNAFYQRSSRPGTDRFKEHNVYYPTWNKQEVVETSQVRKRKRSDARIRWASDKQMNQKMFHVNSFGKQWPENDEQTWIGRFQCSSFTIDSPTTFTFMFMDSCRYLVPLLTQTECSSPCGIVIE